MPFTKNNHAQVTMIMVMSLDGVTARPYEYDVKNWASNEDWEHFKEALNHFDVVITGRVSFTPFLLHRRQQHFYVLTRNESLLNDTTNKNVTYTSATPEVIMSQIYHKFPNAKVALLGGATTNTTFLKDGWVDRLCITVEPKILGAGLHLTNIYPLQVELKLDKISQLNKNGTIVLEYIVSKQKRTQHNETSSLSMIKPQIRSSLNMTKINQENTNWWDERVPYHYKSEFYHVKNFLQGKNSIFTFEVEDLGDVSNKNFLHLQCHMGIDSLSWARLGANVTGLDFSQKAIQTAIKLAKKANIKARFIQANVFEAKQILDTNSFDIVYTNFGSLHWLFDINKWATMVHDLLRENGILYIHDIHPISTALSDELPMFTRDYLYSGAHSWYEPNSYADGCNKTKHNTITVWERPLGEIVTAVARAGFKIDKLEEKNGHLEQQYPYLQKANDGMWYAPSGVAKIPASFVLKAYKL